TGTSSCAHWIEPQSCHWSVDAFEPVVPVVGALVAVLELGAVLLSLPPPQPASSNPHASAAAPRRRIVIMSAGSVGGGTWPAPSGRTCDSPARCCDGPSARIGASGPAIRGAASERRRHGERTLEALAHAPQHPRRRAARRRGAVGLRDLVLGGASVTRVARRRRQDGGHERVHRRPHATSRASAAR